MYVARFYLFDDGDDSYFLAWGVGPGCWAGLGRLDFKLLESASNCIGTSTVCEKTRSG